MALFSAVFVTEKICFLIISAGLFLSARSSQLHENHKTEKIIDNVNHETTEQPGATSIYFNISL